MAGHTLLLNLLGGVALLVWATQMVRKGVMRAFGARLRQAIGEATSHRTKACLTGLGVATALQSSSATGLLVVAFAERGLIALAPALAVMLGADIGSTLVVQALSFNTAALVPVLLIVGVGVALSTKTGLWQQIGRIVIGLALMILSLSLIVGASQPLRETGVFTLVMERLADDPDLALAMGALFTWIAHSSVAVILFVISLAGAGVLEPAAGARPRARRQCGIGPHPARARAALPGSGEAGPVRQSRVSADRRRASPSRLSSTARIIVAALGSDPARAIANAHTGFNIAPRARVPAADRPDRAAARALRARRREHGGRSASTTSTIRCSTGRPSRSPTRPAR